MSSDPALALSDDAVDAVPDLPFRIAFGSYTGTVAAGVLMLGGLLVGIRDAGVLSLASLVAFAGGMLVGVVAAGRWHHGPERMGNSVTRFLLPVPGCLLVVVSGVRLITPAPIAVTVAGLLAGGFLLLTGGILLIMVRSRYVAALLEESAAIVSWEAVTPMRIRVRALAVVVVPFVVGTVLVGYYGLAIVGVGLALVQLVNPTENESIEVRAYEEGLEINNQPFHRGFIPWDQLAGYKHADDRIRIERSWRVDYWYDCEHIDDVAGVVEALDSHLGNS